MQGNGQRRLWYRNMSVHPNKARGNWFSKWRENGKEKRRYFSTEQEAHAFEAERTQAQNEDTRLSLGDLVLAYFRANPDKHPKTKRCIIHILAGYEDAQGNHVEGTGEFLRDKIAECLNRQDLERLRNVYRQRGTSNNSINKYQAYIRAILAWGVDQDLISINPWRDYKLLKVKRPIFQPRVEDLRLLFQELPEYLQWAVKTAFFLALRFGEVELFSLTWNAFNWRRGVVIVRQGKSGKLKTVVPNEKYLAEAWMRYKKDMAAGIPLVCHRAGQKVLSYKTAWKSACRRAGVSMRPYDVRHIAATEMLAQGADLAAVAAQLGHCSVATTGAVYAHVTAGSQAKAASVMPSLDVLPAAKNDR